MENLLNKWKPIAVFIIYMVLSDFTIRYIDNFCLGPAISEAALHMTVHVQYESFVIMHKSGTANGPI